MGLFDTLLGRTKPVQANLDALFALPSAAITLQVTAGLVPTGKAGVCFKPPAGQNFTEMQSELEKLLRARRQRRRAPTARGPPPLAAPAPPRPPTAPLRCATWRPVRLPLDPGRRRRHRGPRHPGPHGALLARGCRAGAPSCCVRCSVRARPGRDRTPTALTEAADADR